MILSESCIHENEQAFASLRSKDCYRQCCACWLANYPVAIDWQEDVPTTCMRL